MNRFTYERNYQDWEEFITDFYLDVMSTEGYSDLNGFLIDYRTDRGSKIWITNTEGENLCIGYIQWEEDDLINMEYEMFRETPIGLVKIRKDS